MIQPAFFGPWPKKRIRLSVTFLTFFALFFVPACTKNNAEPKPVPVIQMRTDASLGSVLTDKDNRTLYYFANDVNGASSRTGGCAALWPAFNAGSLNAADIDPSLSINDFGSINTPNGTQTTYKGRPLYYYAPTIGGENMSEATGETTGENVNGYGLWQSRIILLC